ncbi:MAG: LPXTG cell wall anchor domain-containing protein [Clostridia bacterium]|nr:LPXTG cell wall anchor domain-containing protein [Clostridia bacterium]
MLNINILMVILGAVLAVIGLVGIIRKKEYYLIPFQMGFYMMGFFGARF